MSLRSLVPPLAAVCNELTGKSTVNNREKVISLRNMEPSLVSEKVRLLLESSGRKLTNLKRRPVEAGATESARGVWSQLHAAKKDL